jgi:hypothetical protein
MAQKRYESINLNLFKMDKEQLTNVADFLGVKVLTPLEEKSTVGGKELPGHHDHGQHHDHPGHHDHP